MKGIKPLYADPEIDKAAFYAWNSEGTLRGACEKFKRDGIVSSKGTQYTGDGLRKAAVRYMLLHYEESKTMFKETYFRYGYMVEDVMIERLIIKMAVGTIRNRARIKFWLTKHGLLEKHQSFIESLIAL